MGDISVQKQSKLELKNVSFFMYEITFSWPCVTMAINIDFYSLNVLMAQTLWISTFILVEEIPYFSSSVEYFYQMLEYNPTQTLSQLIKNAYFEDGWQWYHKINNFIVYKFMHFSNICISTNGCAFFYIRN